MGFQSGRIKMKLDKAEKRDRKRRKKDKMVVDNKNIFIVQQAIINRGKKGKKNLDKNE